VLIAGDDQEAKEQVAALVRDGTGFQSAVKIIA
jgi:predicted dinucleotide-binding enzyme